MSLELAELVLAVAELVDDAVTGDVAVIMVSIFCKNH
jgi:hypothetical protein